MTAWGVSSETCSCYNRASVVRATSLLDWGMMEKPLILYSTNTWLAYMISQRYYKTEHYVWCTPYFDPRRSGDRDSAVPPTSSPFEVYCSLIEEVTRRDRHSKKIEENRAGILRGANAKRQSGVIDARQEKDIVSIVDRADSGDFRPLMYVIPYSEVIDRMREPPPEDKAHPLSQEYIIDRLPRELFDVIEFGDYR
jgi:hypothetical protein